MNSNRMGGLQSWSGLFEEEKSLTPAGKRTAISRLSYTQTSHYIDWATPASEEKE